MTLLDSLLSTINADTAIDITQELFEDDVPGLMRYAGVSRRTAGRWLEGHQPSEKNLSKLIERLQATPRVYTRMSGTPIQFTYEGWIVSSDTRRYRYIDYMIENPDWERIGRGIQAGMTENQFARLIWEGYGFLPDRYNLTGMEIEVLA